jgi:hypothetical protein
MRERRKATKRPEPDDYEPDEEPEEEPDEEPEEEDDDHEDTPVKKKARKPAAASAGPRGAGARKSSGGHKSAAAAAAGASALLLLLPPVGLLTHYSTSSLRKPAQAGQQLRCHLRHCSAVTWWTTTDWTWYNWCAPHLPWLFS